VDANAFVPVRVLRHLYSSSLSQRVRDGLLCHGREDFSSSTEYSLLTNPAGY